MASSNLVSQNNGSRIVENIGVHVGGPSLVARVCDIAMNILLLLLLLRLMLIGEYENRELFDLRIPLSRELKEFDAVPLHAVYCHWGVKNMINFI